eukprot:Plantae.Rhodophyta-Rhodochaete_pulchella.ctg7025.p1 GENE.Plantae.Rhodophyta-Rhodochaete_pulchella.ctg7025~~Plantae.Rhodophyta-Rhodochaete_pulchella.ctg7025.p1  ORF type:complete len:295 (-),score=26.69 Plantae.Rhodophyta-Rhodochaete_pulchella.ctg7025:801-1685(-)
MFPDPVPYKVLRLPPLWALDAIDGNPEKEEQWRNAIHIWPARGPSRIVAMPQVGGGPVLGRVCKLVIDAGTDVSQLNKPKTLKHFFEKWYPDLVRAFARIDRVSQLSSPNLDDFVDAVAATPVYQDGRTTFCSRMTHGNIVLLGDAAHSMSPSLGQGANCGFESIPVLLRTLRDSDWDARRALRIYDGLRRADVVAATEMSQWCAAHNGRRRAEFLRAVAIRKALHKALPKLVVEDTPLSRFADPRVSYKSIWAKIFPVMFLVRGIAVVVVCLMVGACSWQGTQSFKMLFELSL